MRPERVAKLYNKQSEAGKREFAKWEAQQKQ